MEGRNGKKTSVKERKRERYRGKDGKQGRKSG